jgi:hypothetical protein
MRTEKLEDLYHSTLGRLQAICLNFEISFLNHNEGTGQNHSQVITSQVSSNESKLFLLSKTRDGGHL